MSFETDQDCSEKVDSLSGNQSDGEKYRFSPAKSLFTSHLDAISVSKNLEQGCLEGHLRAPHPPVSYLCWFLAMLMITLARLARLLDCYT